MIVSKNYAWILSLVALGGTACVAATEPLTDPVPIVAAAVAPPVLPTVTAPDLVSAGKTGVLASVPAQAGASYFWTVTGGTIVGSNRNAAVVFTAGEPGIATVQATVTQGPFETLYAKDIPILAPLPVTSFYYGSGYSADSLANTVLGGVSNTSVSYRFQSKYASALESIRPFFIWSYIKAGYQAGDGGVIRVDLMADDGTGAHLPTGEPLATLFYDHILDHGNNYPKLDFPEPPVLKGGGLYHLVFSNVEYDSVDNYISLDSLYTKAQTTPMQPSIDDRFFAVLLRAGSGAWKVREGFTPIIQMDFANGGTQGNGYMEVWSTNPKVISGNAKVRQTFKVSGPSRSFTKVMIRAQRVVGQDPLTVRVEEANGTVVAEAAVPAREFLESAANWVTVTFPTDHVLATGVGYNLTLSTPATTQYSIYPIRKGKDKGYSNYTVFPDGYAQFTTNGDAGWTGWDMWGTPNLTFSDLQFMFVP